MHDIHWMKDMNQMNYGRFGYIVDSCPKNKTEFTDSAARLNCSAYSNGRSRYVCVPNEKKSAIVEFCNKHGAEVFEKGNCLEVSDKGFLIYSSCQNFTEGCPSEKYNTSDMYNYPACHQINSHVGCYLADPFCRNQMQRTNSDISGSLSGGAIGGITAGTLCVAIVVVMVVMLVLKRRKLSANRREVNISESLRYEDMQSNVQSEAIYENVPLESNISESLLSRDVQNNIQSEPIDEILPIERKRLRWKAEIKRVLGEYDVWKTRVSELQLSMVHRQALPVSPQPEYFGRVACMC